MGCAVFAVNQTDLCGDGYVHRIAAGGTGFIAFDQRASDGLWHGDTHGPRPVCGLQHSGGCDLPDDGLDTDAADTRAHLSDVGFTDWSGGQGCAAPFFTRYGNRLLPLPMGRCGISTRR